MAKTISASVEAEIRYSFENTDEVATTREAPSIVNQNDYTTGDGANGVELIWRKQIVVTATSPNYDITIGTALEDVFGDELDFRGIKAMSIQNLSETAGDDIYVGPMGLDNGFKEPWGGDNEAKNTVRATGQVLFDTPINEYPTPNTSRRLRVQYQGTSGSISVVIVLMGIEGLGEESSSSASSSSWSSWSSSSESTSSASSSSSSSSSVQVSSSSAAQFSSTSSSSAVLEQSSGGSSASSSSSVAFSSSSSVALSSSSSSSSSSSIIESGSSASSSSSVGVSSSSSPSSLSSSSEYDDFSSSSAGESPSSSSSSSAGGSSSSSSSSTSLAESQSSGPDDLFVTGALTPDVTGTYSKWGNWQGTQYWKQDGGAWYIWWDGIAFWYISDAVDEAGSIYWSMDGSILNPAGTYDPGAGALGTATVS